MQALLISDYAQPKREKVLPAGSEKKREDHFFPKVLTFHLIFFFAIGIFHLMYPVCTNTQPIPPIFESRPYEALCDHRCACHHDTFPFHARFGRNGRGFFQ
jgi:hypothetical protein